MENKRIFYKAIVYSEPDTLGGVKIRIPELHGLPLSSLQYLKDDQLPYAYPATQFRAYDWGQSISPLIGTQVYVAPYDDSTYIYFGNSIPSGNFIGNTSIRDVFMGNQIRLEQPASIVQPNYKTTIFKSLKGSTIEISDQDISEYIRIIGPQGGAITIGHKGYYSQRRGDRIKTILSNQSPSNPSKTIELDTYIDIDDGKGNQIVIDKNGVTINCKHLQLNVESSNLKDIIT